MPALTLLLPEVRFKTGPVRPPIVDRSVWRPRASRACCCHAPSSQRGQVREPSWDGAPTATTLLFIAFSTFLILSHTHTHTHTHTHLFTSLSLLSLLFSSLL